MNVPSHPEGNWSWRLRDGQLTPQLARKLAALVEVTDRDPCVKQPSPQVPLKQATRRSGSRLRAQNTSRMFGSHGWH